MIEHNFSIAVNIFVRAFVLLLSCICVALLYHKCLLNNYRQCILFIAIAKWFSSINSKKHPAHGKTIAADRT